MRICQRFWSTNWGCPIDGPNTVVEGGKTPKGSLDVKAGQEEKSLFGHQLQSTSSTGFSLSSSSSSSSEGSYSERKKIRWFMRICQRFWSTNWCRPIAGPDNVIEGGKTPKGSSEVNAGQEEKSSFGHQLQSTSLTGFSSSSSSSSSLEGSSSERKKMMIHANLSKILKLKLRLPRSPAWAPGRQPGHRNRGW